MRILITGHKGFIGRHCFNYLKEIYDVVGVDKSEHPYTNLIGEISGILEDIDIVIHFAAKTFVDHSIKDPSCFVKNNIIGSFNLLEEARRYPVKKFIIISTDEVYGSINKGFHKESSVLNPGNPYSATKASVDMMALSYLNTYRIPVIILRPENNYGAFQHKQKAIPNWINKALKDEYLIVYGDGQHKRMWLRVEDCCEAVQCVIEKGIIGEIYNVGGQQEESNINMAKRILKKLKKPENLIRFVPDEIVRPGHDRRYGIDTSKINNLGWRAQKTLEDIDEVINWYKENPWWFK